MRLMSLFVYAAHANSWWESDSGCGGTGGLETPLDVRYKVGGCHETGLGVSLREE